MLKKKAVARYQNGEIIKGWVEEFKPEQESFILFPLIEYSEEERIEIKYSSLKAVFFVKDFIGDKDYKKVKKNVIDKVVNDIAMEPTDNFIISQPATFMRFLNSNFILLIEELNKLEAIHLYKKDVINTMIEKFHSFFLRLFCP